MLDEIRKIESELVMDLGDWSMFSWDIDPLDIERCGDETKIPVTIKVDGKNLSTLYFVYYLGNCIYARILNPAMKM